MQQIPKDEFINHVNKQEISPWAIYGADLGYDQYFSVDHYIKFNDTIEMDQKLNILFVDIEVYGALTDGVFPSMSDPKYPINAITLHSTFNKTYYAFVLVDNLSANVFANTTEIEKYYKQELIKQGYIDDDEDIKIYTYINELDMHKGCWELIHKLDPTILSGYNMDLFDLPYIYYRILKLMDGDKKAVASTMSKLGSVKERRFHNSTVINIADYPTADALYLYKPRSDGGLNYGQMQPSYSLDYVSGALLGLKKLEYNSGGDSLDVFYRKDPVHYLLYNIIDVILCKRLNEKLKHIELHNLLRRFMRTPFTRSLTGSAALYDTFVSYELAKDGKYPRFGIVDETAVQISEEEINKFPKPKTKMKWTVRRIPKEVFRSIVNRYPGALTLVPSRSNPSRIIPLIQGNSDFHIC